MPEPKEDFGASLRRTPLLGGLLRAWDVRLTPRGRYLLVVLGVLALVGLDTRRTQVCILFAAAAVVTTLAFRFRGRFRRRASASRNPAATPVAHVLSPEMRSLLDDIDAFCTAHGAPRPPFRAPREHLADRGIPLGEDERSMCLRAVCVLYEQAYGERPPNPREFAGLAAGVAALRARGAGSSGTFRPIA